MLALIIAAIVLFYVLVVLLIVRAAAGRFFSEFPFFFSYLIYLVATSVLINLADITGARFYVTAYWWRFFTLAVAEFALLLEIADHLFRPYPAIRKMGRLITLGITLVFSVLYIVPPLLESRPSSLAILELMKRSALTKGMVIVALLAAARYYRVRVNRNVAGLILGLAADLTISIANFALAEFYGRELYGPIFSTIGPLKHTLCMLIWTVALWRPEPEFDPAREIAAARGASEPVPNRLEKVNVALTRLLRK